MKFKHLFIFIAGIFLSSSVLAQSSGVGATLDTMFSNFSGSAHELIRLTKTVATVIGIYLVINSIFSFAKLGQGQITIKTPLMSFFSGIALFAFASSIAVVSQTLAMGTNPSAEAIAPVISSFKGTSAAAIKGILLFVQLIGYIACIRGWLLVNQSAAQQAQAGTLARGVWHIVGGVAAINMTTTAKILANTFAPGIALPF